MFDFVNLRKAHWGDDDCFTAFAYWIGVVTDPKAETIMDAGNVRAAMNYQFEVEEQTVDESGLWQYDDWIPLDVFRLIAPVTVALGWAPFEAAIAALGEPINLAQERGYVVATFRPRATPTFSANTVDERHFLFLLKSACEQALASRHYVLVAGAVGYSYEEASIDGFPEAQALMRQAGFVWWDRVPRE